MTWDPILEGALADRARTVLAEVCEGLARCDGAPHELALFWTYAQAALDDDPRIAVHHEAALGRFAAAFDQPPTSLALHGGLCGRAWVAAHVAEDVEPLLAAVDAAVLGALADWRGPYDLISGLAGIAVYLREREHAAGLARIVEILDGLAVRSADGIAWWTRPEHMGDAHRARYPDGLFDCGVAHGVAGAIAILARIDGDRARALRDDAVRWLLAQRASDGRMPGVAGGAAARTAWCYGDPGVAIALASAGVHDTAWTARAPASVFDAALCHGDAGIAHVANRLFHATRDAQYLAVSRAHFAHALARHRSGEGIGGFVMERAGGPLVTSSIVEGTIGVGLALISALAPIEPLWDRLFLCDLPVVIPTRG